MAYLAGMGATLNRIVAVEVSADEDVVENGKRVDEALPQMGIKRSGKKAIDSNRQKIALRGRGRDSQSFQVQRGVENRVYDPERNVLANEDRYASSSAFQMVLSDHDKVWKGRIVFWREFGFKEDNNVVIG